ncbi:hypothetical protein [Streptomyces griseoflavus]|uniref:hypothetical protein n=1 Tax=Streptomyces griseoflavus TaxID=35619 RepID=UPI003F4CEDF7
MSFQRPDKRAVEQDPEAVVRWHEEAWPQIRAKVKRDGGERPLRPATTEDPAAAR